MDNSYWTRFISFIKDSFTQKFKYCFPGCIMGLFGAKSLLFAGLSSEMVTLGAYCLKFVGTVLMATGSGLGTAYGALLIEKYKSRQKKSPLDDIKRKKRNAA